MKSRRESFSCPVCGEDVPPNAKSCPECGACEKSGWSEDTYLDGIGLPDNDDDEYERERPLGRHSSGASKQARLQWLWWLVALVVLLAFAATVFMR